MTPEERLDRLIAQQRAGMTPPNDPADAARLAAADAVSRLNRLSVPDDLARRLEARVRDRARELAAKRGTTGHMPPHAGRRVIAIAAVAAALMFGLTAFAFTASAGSLPGDWLYPVKQLRNQIALTTASSPADQTHIAIQQMYSALRDVQSTVQSHRSDSDIQQALAELHAANTAAQQAANALPVGATRARAQTQIATAQQAEVDALRQLISTVDWPSRLAFTATLSSLGVTTPNIASVQVTPLNGNRVQLTITGANFASATQVVFADGSDDSLTTESITSTQIVVDVALEALAHHDYTMIVANPDGTAAQTHVTGLPENPQQTPGPDGTPGNNGKHNNGTPTPDPSGTPDNGNNGKHKGQLTPTPTP